MANTETADVMPVGTTYTEPNRGSFIKNCYSLPPQTWQVREGFGRIYTNNTSYSLQSLDKSLTPFNVGYYKQLGSCSFTTSFGHRQILSLFIANISPLNRDGADGATDEENVYSSIKQTVISEHSYQYVVVIYDVSTNRHYEQIIGGKTSEIEDIIPMEQQLGFYDRDLVVQTNTKVFPLDPETNDPFYWAELNSPTLGDVIYFGTSQLGLYAYRPIIFDAPPDIQVETTMVGTSYTLGGMAGRVGWSETGFIEKCSAGEGLLVGGFTYLNASEFPVPADITAINNRLAMASGRSIYFSDTFNGSAIIADNILSVPTDNPITAISEINGVLLIFTATETFMYQPSVGSEIQTSGRTIKLNSNWGCLNSQAKIKVENRLFFCDDTGIYVSDGTEIKDIADPIRPLFRRFVEEPLSYYNRASEDGATDIYVENPKIYYDWKAIKGLHFAKNPLNSLVFCVLPEQKMAWVIDKDQMFSIWSWKTLANQDPNDPYYYSQFSVLENDFRLVDNGDDLFIVNLETKDIDTGAFPTSEGDFSFRQIRANNIYKWKVVRGVDFSLSFHEDKKVYQKSLKVMLNPPLKEFQFVIGKPVEVYDGIITDHGSIFGNTNALLENSPTYLVPFGIAGNTAEAIEKFNIEITFNNAYWEIPTFTNGIEANYIDLIWHPNRLASADNFGWTNPIAGNRTVRLQNPSTIQIDFDGSFAPTYFGNYLNILNQVQPLFWVPMRLKQHIRNQTTGVGWSCPFVETNSTANNTVVMSYEFGAVERDFSNQEIEGLGFRNGSIPIEWTIQTQAISGEKDEIIKARGGYLQVFSNGPWPNVFNLPAPYENYVSDRGLINAMITSDYNNYQGQVVDWTITPPAINDGLIADTDNVGLPTENYGLVDIQDVSQGEFTNNVNQNQPKIFGNTSATYANQQYVPPQVLGGTILVDGEDVYNTSFSTSTKGTSFFITLYGYCQSYATKLFITKFNSAFRVMSDARRRWKSGRGEQ